MRVVNKVVRASEWRIKQTEFAINIFEGGFSNDVKVFLLLLGSGGREHGCNLTCS